MGFREIIKSGSRSVVISANQAEGPFLANVYVNCDGDDLGDITPVRATRRRLASIRNWAACELAR